MSIVFKMLCASNTLPGNSLPVAPLSFLLPPSQSDSGTWMQLSRQASFFPLVTLAPFSLNQCWEIWGPLPQCKNIGSSYNLVRNIRKWIYGLGPMNLCILDLKMTHFLVNIVLFFYRKGTGDRSSWFSIHSVASSLGENRTLGQEQGRREARSSWVRGKESPWCVSWRTAACAHWNAGFVAAPGVSWPPSRANMGSGTWTSPYFRVTLIRTEGGEGRPATGPQVLLWFPPPLPHSHRSCLPRSTFWAHSMLVLEGNCTDFPPLAHMSYGMRVQLQSGYRKRNPCRHHLGFANITNKSTNHTTVRCKVQNFGWALQVCEEQRARWVHCEWVLTGTGLTPNKKGRILYWYQLL